MLVFLHEGLGSVAQWKDFPEEICRKAQLPALLYDRQGYGQSPPVAGERTTDYLHEAAFEELPALLEAEKITAPLILLGHSDGASIALLFAAAFPERVKAVIAMAPHVYVEREAVEGIEKVVDWYEKGNLKALLEKYHGSKTNWLFYAWADTWRSPAFADWNIEEYLPKIKAPVLVIQGEEDEFASRQHPAEIVLKTAGQLFYPEKCGHQPHLEARQQVVEHILEFIEKAL